MSTFTNVILHVKGNHNSLNNLTHMLLGRSSHESWFTEFETHKFKIRFDTLAFNLNVHASLKDYAYSLLPVRFSKDYLVGLSNLENYISQHPTMGSGKNYKRAKERFLGYSDCFTERLLAVDDEIRAYSLKYDTLDLEFISRLDASYHFAMVAWRTLIYTQFPELKIEQEFLSDGEFVPENADEWSNTREAEMDKLARQTASEFRSSVDKLEMTDYEAEITNEVRHLSQVDEELSLDVINLSTTIVDKFNESFVPGEGITALNEAVKKVHEVLNYKYRRNYTFNPGTPEAEMLEKLVGYPITQLNFSQCYDGLSEQAARLANDRRHKVMLFISKAVEKLGLPYSEICD